MGFSVQKIIYQPVLYNIYKFHCNFLTSNEVITIEMSLPLFLELRLFVTMFVLKFKNGNLVMLFW